MMKIFWIPSVGGMGILLAIGLSCISSGRASEDWPVIFSDDFARSHPAPHWIEDHGGNLGIKNGRLNFRGAAKFECTVPLPREAFEVRMELLVPGGEVHLAVRDGALFAGGGLQKDRGETFGITMRTSETPGEVLNEVFPAAEMNETRERVVVPVAAGEMEVVMTYRDGRATATVDGSKVLDMPLPLARSEFNRFVTLQAEQVHGAGAELLSFSILGPENSPPGIPLQANTPEENRAATVEIREVPDPEAAGILFQEALDSLPPQGGVVLLPEGTFPLRRSLELRSHVSLRGRGAGRTILEVARPTSVAINQLTRKDARTLEVEDASWLEGIRAGDSLVFSIDGPRALIVVSKEGMELTFDRDLPVDITKEKGLHHFFRAINCEEAEFVEASDLSISMVVEPRPIPDGGTYLPAVRFRSVAGGKISRVDIGPWSGDGIYLTSSECSVSDNTVRRTKMGIHFGGSELNLCTGNLVSENSFCGFYFCSYPRDCILSGNTIDGFQGLADPGDTGNLIAFNDVTANSALEGNWLALLYGNRLSALFVGMIPWKEGQPERKILLDHFLLARNRIGSVQPGVYSGESNISGLLWADNTAMNGTTPVQLPEFPNSLVLNGTGLPGTEAAESAGCGRTEPMPPPELRLPVLDGREFYDPSALDQGFQKALDQLAKSGGSLQLPGGRYQLGVPLRVPSGVTLTGYGVATVLCPTPGGKQSSLVVVSDATDTVIRDLSILASYSTQADRQPAIAVNASKNVRIEAVDVRGWEGDGLWVIDSEIHVVDSRAFGNAGAGFSFSNTTFSLDGLLVKSCGSGISALGAGKGSSLRNVIASRNLGAGFTLRKSSGIVLSACLSSRNGEDGFLISSSSDISLLGCIAMQNSLSEPGEFAGVQLAEGTTGTTVAFCLLFDAQGPVATQSIAIREDASCMDNIIRANIETDRARAALLRTGTMPESRITSDGSRTIASDNLPLR